MLNTTQTLLDRFLEAYFYSQHLTDRGASKSEHDRAIELLTATESKLFAHLSVDSGEKFECLLTLADNYRNDEKQYDALLRYANDLAETSR